MRSVKNSALAELIARRDSLAKRQLQAKADFSMLTTWNH